MRLILYFVVSLLELTVHNNFYYANAIRFYSTIQVEIPEIFKTYEDFVRSLDNLVYSYSKEAAILEIYLKTRAQSENLNEGNKKRLIFDNRRGVAKLISDIDSKFYEVTFGMEHEKLNRFKLNLYQIFKD